MTIKVMRIPLYMKGNQTPTKKDAYVLFECVDRAEAERALAVLHAFSTNPPPPMQRCLIHHFIQED